MGKIKKLSLVIILLSVIFIGVFLGQKMLKFLEDKSLPPQQPSSIQKTEIPMISVKSASQTLTLYSLESNSSETSKLRGTLPSSTPNVAVSGVVASQIHSLPTKTAQLIDENSFASIASGEKWVAYSAGRGINVREGPSTDSKQLFKIGQDTKGTVLERNSGWTKIKWDFNRKIGWVRDDLLQIGPETLMNRVNQSTPNEKGEPAKTSNPSGTSKKTSEKIAEAAKKITVVVAKPSPPSETVKSFSPKSLPKEGMIIPNFANIRALPNSKAGLLGKVPKGVIVKIDSSKQVGKYYWFKITYNNGKKNGWTREDNIRF